MAVELDDHVLEALEILSRTKRDPLCPNCGRREQDPRSRNGWCWKCDSDRERLLEQKRDWWHRNKGNGQG